MRLPSTRSAPWTSTGVGPAFTPEPTISRPACLSRVPAEVYQVAHEMNRIVIKIIAYAALALGLVLFGILFSLEFSRRNAARPPEPVKQQPEGEPAPKAIPLPPEPPNHFMVYLGLFLGCGIALGLMAARDLSTFVGQEAIDYIFNDDGDGQRDPDYEAAEMEATNGNPLEITTNVERAFITGREIDLSNKQRLLDKKYREKYRQLGITR